MTVRAFPAPTWPTFGKPGWCKWCGETIPTVIDGKKSTQRMWHPACAHEFNLHTRAETQYAHLVERDGEVCQCCPHGTPPPKRCIRETWEFYEFRDSRRFGTTWDEEYLASLWPDPFPGVPIYKRSPEDQLYGQHFRVRFDIGLEVDHRTPLWEVADLPAEDRRWYFGPGNLWLLCFRCHRLKTAREAGRRAYARRMAAAQLGLPLG